MTKISIEGNICSGKTFYLKLLEKEGYNVHYNENIEQSEMAHKYNTDVKRYSLGYYLDMLHNYIHSSINDDDLHFYEGSPLTIKHVYGELSYEKNSFDVDEYKIYNDYYEDFSWKPDIIIYLFCSPVICSERNKNRQPNNPVDMEYLKELHLKYEILCDEINCPVTMYKINSQENSTSVLNNINDIICHLKK